MRGMTIKINDSIRSTCLDCKKRYLGCHSECEEYKAYRAKVDNLKKKKTGEWLRSSEYAGRT